MTDTDVWSEWLLHRRHADDEAFGNLVKTDVGRYAEQVLDAAMLAPGQTLADIGTGEGLIALRAIERIGNSLRVILTDISPRMLQHTEALARQRGVREQCTFVHCAADRLSAIPDGSVDVVTTRSVLAYVADKPAALREFKRILRPRGRISLAEPILQDDALMASALRQMIESRNTRSPDPFLPLLHRWKAAQYPDTPEKIAQSPIANYSERNLFDFVRACGFTEIRLQLHIEMIPSIIRSWEVFLNFSPHPWAPTLQVVLAEQFSEAERQLFEKTVRPIVESPEAMTTSRMAFLSATKPAEARTGGFIDTAVLAIDT